MYNISPYMGKNVADTKYFDNDKQSFISKIKS